MKFYSAIIHAVIEYKHYKNTSQVKNKDLIELMEKLCEVVD